MCLITNLINAEVPRQGLEVPSSNVSQKKCIIQAKASFLTLIDFGQLSAMVATESV